MKFGVVGNLIIYGGSLSLFGYLVWEINKMSDNMAKFDEDHPMNEIYEKKNFQKFLQSRSNRKFDESLLEKKNRKLTTIEEKNEEADI